MSDAWDFLSWINFLWSFQLSCHTSDSNYTHITCWLVNRIKWFTSIFSLLALSVSFISNLFCFLHLCSSVLLLSLFVSSLFLLFLSLVSFLFLLFLLLISSLLLLLSLSVSSLLLLLSLFVSSLFLLLLLSVSLLLSLFHLLIINDSDHLCYSSEKLLRCLWRWQIKVFFVLFLICKTYSDNLLSVLNSVIQNEKNIKAAMQKMWECLKLSLYFFI